MKKHTLHTSFAVLMLLSFTLTHAQKAACKLYSNKGKEVRYERMLDDCKKADVVLFGELHNDPIAHWMQFELTKDQADISSLEEETQARPIISWRSRRP